MDLVQLTVNSQELTSARGCDCTFAAAAVSVDDDVV
jgi:hypothetical protein